uniref:interferon lambda receptor 1-like n=1 Tax=Scatophagus argus TaxID=75038 RepID=UPI001ED84224|nr:interferon lambda receptor 1-like [Scatophagus argus]XP_046261165.1 interferon lambda receptor 1-like [Scatophagus argus]
MTALIWTLVWLLQVLPAVSQLPKPVNLSLFSRNFHHMLTWAPGPGSPTGVYYRVEVAESSQDKFAAVTGCERVRHPLVCNLTQAFSDKMASYFTQVTAQLDTQTSPSASCPSFEPSRDTELDLPLLTMTPCGKHLCVDLQPPMEHLRNFYEIIEYKLRIKYGDVEREQSTKSLTRLVFQDLSPGRRYCVSVCFSDSVLIRKSNYSQPVCAFTLGGYNKDALISALLSVLVMFVLVVVALLVAAGYVCLTGRQPPWVLTSIFHADSALVLVPQSTSFTSLLYVESTLPSTGENGSNQKPSDESDAESESSESEGDYQLRLAADLLSSCSPSLLPLSAPVPLEPEPDTNSDPTSDSVGPHPVAETRSGGALSDVRNTQPHPPAGGLPDKKEEEEELSKEEKVGDRGSQGVDLLTLTFGREEEEVEEEEVVVEEKSQVEPSAPAGAAPVLSSQTWDMEEAASETVSCSEDEDEDSGYIGRPCTRDLKNLL